MMVSFSQLFKRRGQQGGGREKRRQEARGESKVQEAGEYQTREF